MYHYFSGCAANSVAITLTWIGILIITILQLTGSEGSVLTTSVISAYATYLAYSIVSKNPDGQCNPTLGSNDVIGIVVGLFFTMVSLAWTGWSWTAQDRLNLEGYVHCTAGHFDVWWQCNATGFTLASHSF